MIDCQRLRATTKPNPPATEEEIAALEAALSLRLAAAYRVLLSCANGLSAHEDISSFALYSADDLPERNETYEVAIYAPTLLMIGDTGGGDAILIDRDADDPVVYMIGMGSMHPDDAVILAPNFSTWVNEGFPLAPKYNW